MQFRKFRAALVTVIACMALAGCTQPAIKKFRMDFGHIKFDVSDFKTI